MATPPGKAPILETASAGLRFAVQRLQANAPIAAAGAALMAVLGILAVRLGAGGALLSQLIGLVIAAGIFTLFLRGAFAHQGAPVAGGALGGFGRVLGAMIVVGFFLFIVAVILSIVAIVVLGAAISPYLADFEAAQGDPQATLALFEQIVQQNPAPFLIIFAVFGFVWMALTSRLYLAAPASLAQGRVLTFETWAWTKGNMFRIIAARLVLLAPIIVVVMLVQAIIGAVLGADASDPAALQALAADPLRYVAFAFISNFVTFALYNAAEAGLSVVLYRGLRPAETAAPQV